MKGLSPLHFLFTQCLQPFQKMLLLPTSVRQKAHGILPELCRRSRPVPQIMIFVFPAFTLSFLLHCFFLSQKPPDTFLKRFSDDNKVICIEILPGDPRAELALCFKYLTLLMPMTSTESNPNDALAYSSLLVSQGFLHFR